MKQLLPINSQQLTVPLAKPHPKPIPPASHKLPTPASLKNIAIFKSKKRIKRVEQIVEPTTAIGLYSDAETRPMAKNELKQYVIGQLTNINTHLTPLTMKLGQSLEKRKACGLRCSTEGQEQEESLLFTFYPKQKHSQDQLGTTVMPQEARRMEGRSYSLKNSPIVCYPHSNKVLPKAFRVRTEIDPSHMKRYSELSKQQQPLPHQGMVLKESNQNMNLPLNRVRTFSIRSKMPSDSSHHSQKLHKPVLQALQERSP